MSSAPDVWYFSGTKIDLLELLNPGPSFKELIKHNCMRSNFLVSKHKQDTCHSRIVCLKEHYRLGFASKNVASSVSTL